MNWSFLSLGLHHLKQEVEELIRKPDDIEEYADCMILLIQSAIKAGYNMDLLHKACLIKHDMNKSREWGKADENGVVNHIKS